MLHSPASVLPVLANAAADAAMIIAQIPEANTLTLFALGLAGLVLGHRLSRERSDRNK